MIIYHCSFLLCFVLLHSRSRAPDQATVDSSRRRPSAHRPSVVRHNRFLRTSPADRASRLMPNLVERYIFTISPDHFFWWNILHTEQIMVEKFPNFRQNISLPSPGDVFFSFYQILHFLIFLRFYFFVFVNMDHIWGKNFKRHLL